MLLAGGSAKKVQEISSEGQKAMQAVAVSDNS